MSANVDMGATSVPMIFVACLKDVPRDEPIESPSLTLRDFGTRWRVKLNSGTNLSLERERE